jgi:dihydroorotate dehydrogenase
MVKVSPDEDSDEQISGIVEAVWHSGVDGVIVGNTTKKRPDDGREFLSRKELSLMQEHGGYSGPKMFERTLDLVGRYRKALDDGPKPPQAKPVGGSLTGESHESSILEKLESSSPLTSSDKANSADSNTSAKLPSESGPLSSNVDDLEESGPTVEPTKTQRTSTVNAPLGPRKIIFATGGITNGAQARAVLDAGASVAMVYTAMIYGGAGTISRIKQEMRELAQKK